jgi:hypothetical protein
MPGVVICQMTTQFIVRLAMFLAVVAIADCFPVSAQPVTFASPEQFLADKETDFVAIVKVTRVENRWVVLPDGDHLPVVVVDSRMEEVIAGTAWPLDSVQSTLQFDYNDLMFEPIAPPAIPDRRYVVWGLRSSTDGEIPAIAPWTAHPQGVLLIRRQNGQEFVFWNGKGFELTALRQHLKSEPRLPLDRIVDPALRLKIAEARLESGTLGDEKAFVRGLVLNIVDPEEQAKRIERTSNADSRGNPFGMSDADTTPHELWYSSVALLRDLGKEEGRRDAAIAALTPIATTARPRIRLAAALALVDLGSAAGRAALIAGFESESGAISSDPADDMTFPGRYPYDDSSIAACSHALARLGDRRGLTHPRADVRLAAAQAFRDTPDAEVKKVLEALAGELEPQVEKLRVAGDLTKPRGAGDFTNRYPDAWVRTHRLLSRFGDELSLRLLLDAYVLDFKTYPEEHAPIVPMARPFMSSTGSSLAGAIHDADASPTHLLERLQKLLPDQVKWASPPLSALRASLDPASDKSAEPVRQKPAQSEIVKLLADSDPNKRAEALAAAGYHQFADLFDTVLGVAANGSGVERRAAIYALGFYDRDAPDTLLRHLMVSHDLEIRVSGFELATRKNAARFARESMDVVRAVVKPSQSDRRSTTAPNPDLLPRILSRLARGPLPAPLLDGLADPDPQVRLIVIEGLALAGNLDAEPALRPLTRHRDRATRDAAAKAIEQLGPIDR